MIQNGTIRCWGGTGRSSPGPDVDSFLEPIPTCQHSLTEECHSHERISPCSHQLLYRAGKESRKEGGGLPGASGRGSSLNPTSTSAPPPPSSPSLWTLSQPRPSLPPPAEGPTGSVALPALIAAVVGGRSQIQVRVTLVGSWFQTRTLEDERVLTLSGDWGGNDTRLWTGSGQNPVSAQARSAFPGEVSETEETTPSLCVEALNEAPDAACSCFVCCPETPRGRSSWALSSGPRHVLCTRKTVHTVPPSLPWALSVCMEVIFLNPCSSLKPQIKFGNFNQ